jgi:ketosteroid isomerase-like protein
MAELLDRRTAMVRDDEVELIRLWFRRLAECMQAVDYAAARPLFAEDVIAFGSLAGFVAGREALEREQWRNVWGTIDGSRFRLEDLRTIVSADRLTAAGMVMFDSTGYGQDGTPYERPGRSTVMFGRGAVGEDWVARHVHFSLSPGVPPRSFGRKPETMGP